MRRRCIPPRCPRDRHRIAVEETVSISIDHGTCTFALLLNVRLQRSPGSSRHLKWAWRSRVAR